MQLSKRALALYALLFTALASLPTRADTITFSLSGGDNSTFTLTQTNGLVTGITGMFDGAQIASLLAPQTFGGNDNRLYGNSPYIDTSGISFSLSSPDSYGYTDINLGPEANFFGTCQGNSLSTCNGVTGFSPVADTISHVSGTLPNIEPITYTASNDYYFSNSGSPSSFEEFVFTYNVVTDGALGYVNPCLNTISSNITVNGPIGGSSPQSISLGDDNKLACSYTTSGAATDSPAFDATPTQLIWNFDAPSSALIVSATTPAGDDASFSLYSAEDPGYISFTNSSGGVYTTAQLGGTLTLGVAPTPEPGTFGLLTIGFLSVWFFVQRSTPSRRAGRVAHSQPLN